MSLRGDGYILLEKIGEGWSGEVYRARQSSLQREVVLKLFRKDLPPGGRFLERLEHEARLASQLRHPRLARIYDCGWQDGRFYLAMEWIAGKTVQERLSVDPDVLRPLADSIVLDLLDALSILHEQGLVHRNLGARNVAIGDDGHGVLMDFGLLKDLESDGSHLTAPGAGGEIPRDLAPEVLAGEPASPASDLWAVGCLWITLHAGRHPFERENPASTLRAIEESRIPPLGSSCPALDPALHPFVRRLLARDPKDRFRDAGEALRHLRGPVTAPPRLPGAILPILGWLVGAVLMVAGALWIAFDTSPAAPRATSSASGSPLPGADALFGSALEQLDPENRLSAFRKQMNGLTQDGKQVRRLRHAVMLAETEALAEIAGRLQLRYLLHLLEDPAGVPALAAISGPGRYWKLTDLALLEGGLRVLGGGLELPLEAAYPPDCGPMSRDPGGYGEVVSLYFAEPDRRQSAEVVGDRRSRQRLVSRSGTQFLQLGEGPLETAESSVYIHRELLDLRPPRDGERVFLEVEARRLGPGQRILVDWSSQETWAPAVRITGHAEAETTHRHRIPIVWIREAARLRLRYEDAGRLPYDRGAEVRCLSFVYLADIAP